MVLALSLKEQYYGLDALIQKIKAKAREVHIENALRHKNLKVSFHEMS